MPSVSSQDSLATDPELAGWLRRVAQPGPAAAGLPNESYASARFARLERDRVLARTWVGIGTGAAVPRPGDVKPVTLLGLPLILLRDRAGAVRVFHNVCSHRGMELVGAPCSGQKLLRCPYHAWAYSLDGRLQATPLIGGPGRNDCEGFDKAEHGLKEVRSASFADIVFVDLSGEAGPFEDFIAPVTARWHDIDWSQLRHGGPESGFALEIGCNWKLAVENYCESYHLPWIHPGLNSYSRIEDHYNIEAEDAFSGQGSLAYRPSLSADGQAFPTFAGLDPRWEGIGEYLALYPNVLLGVHADHFFVVCLIPLAEDRTLELFDIYYVGEEARGEPYRALREANARQWRAVFLEDQGVVEGMQRGRNSPAFLGGAFSPVMDGPTHCFHRWMARALLRGLGAEEPALRQVV